jgi:RNA polymerase sigma-70 factor (sigma-E family)
MNAVIVGQPTGDQLPVTAFPGTIFAAAATKLAMPRLVHMNPTSGADTGAATEAKPQSPTGPASSAEPAKPADPAEAVSAMYQAHALSMIRLAHVIVGSRATAEDVVQDAFLGLYRRWNHLASTDKALSYVRSSVLNGCRSVLRGNARLDLSGSDQAATLSAETTVLASEDHRQLANALRGLPHRQRSVLVLRYYLDVADEQIARDLAVSESTVRSVRRRGLAALRRALREAQ